MATREIKTKLAVDGLGEYKSAMSDAASSMKVLNSEANLAAAQFKATGDEQQYLADMADILSSKITTQQSAVDAAKSALADLASAGYAANSREVETWQTKLNNAETKLTEYQTALENTQGKLEQFTGFKDVADAIGASADNIQTYYDKLAQVDAQYQTTGDQQQYLIDKCAALQDAIEGQKKIIGEAEDALKQLAADGFDANSDEVMAWQGTLNDAKDKLGELETELGTAQDKLTEIQGVFETTADKVSTAKDKIDEINSALNLADAKYDAGAISKEDYLNSKADLLKDKLDEQQKIVDTLKDGLDALLNAGYNSESSAIVKWQTDLNKAEADLLRTQTEFNDAQASLDALDQGLDTTEQNAGDTQKAVENIGKQISIEGVLKSLESIESKLTGLINKAAQAAKALIDVSSDSAGWADDLLTESSQYGIDQETLQQMRYASKFIDTEVSSIEQAYVRLGRNAYDAFNDPGSQMADYFAEAGITLQGIDGQLRSTWDIFWELMDNMSQWDSNGRDGLMQHLVGKQSKDFNPLLEAGVDAYMEKMGEAPVVTAENVQALGQLNDAYDELDSQLEATKLELMGELAPAFETCATAISGLLEKFNEYIKSEEGQAAIDKVTTALENLINTIANEDTIETIFDKITSAVQAVSDALTWVLENEQLVKDAALAIGGAFAAIKLSESVLQFMQLVNGAKGLFNLGGGGSGGGGAASTAVNAAGNAAGAVAGKAAAAGKSLFDGAKNLGSTIANGVKSALPAVGSALGAAAPWAIVAGGAYTAGRALDNKATQDYNDTVIAPIQEQYDAALQASGDKYIDALQGIYKQGADLLLDSNDEIDYADQVAGVKNLLQGYGGIMQQVLADQDLDLFSAIADKLGVSEAEIPWDHLFDSQLMQESTGEIIGNAVEAIQALGEALANGTIDPDQLARMLEGLQTATETAGKEMETTLTTATETATANAAAQAEAGGAEIGASMTAAMDNATAEAADIAHDGGENAGMMVDNGMINGINANAGAVLDAAASLANSVLSIIDSAFVIRSPSHVMAEKGKYIAQGLAEGIEDATWMVSDAATQMAGAVNAEPLYTGRSGTNGGGYGTSADMVHVTLTMDKKVVGETVAPIVDDVIGMEIARR